MVSENKLEDIIRASIENMRSMVNANTVIGDPYTTPGGITIIPVSKISVGFASGGLVTSESSLRSRVRQALSSEIRRGRRLWVDG